MRHRGSSSSPMRSRTFLPGTLWDRSTPWAHSWSRSLLSCPTACRSSCASVRAAAEAASVGGTFCHKCKHCQTVGRKRQNLAESGKMWQKAAVATDFALTRAITQSSSSWDKMAAFRKWRYRSTPAAAQRSQSKGAKFTASAQLKPGGEGAQHGGCWLSKGRAAFLRPSLQSPFPATPLPAAIHATSRRHSDPKP